VLTLTEQETNEIIDMLGEVPFKYSYPVIAHINKKYADQNKKEDPKEEEK
jgi:hypothetical protein